MEGDADLGYFFRDTRFLSQCTLRVNGRKPVLLRAEQVDYFSACFYLSLPADIRQRAVAKIADIDSKIRSLQSIKGILEEITEACHGDGTLSDCPILETLEK